MITRNPRCEFRVSEFQRSRSLMNEPDMERPAKPAFLREETPEPLTDETGDGEGRTHRHELEGRITLRK